MRQTNVHNNLGVLSAALTVWFHRPYLQSEWRRHWAVAGCILLLVVLAACNRGGSSSRAEKLVADTVEIAQEYVHTNDLEQARARLATLDVANPNQWIVVTAEIHIIEQADVNATIALVRLSFALNMRSEVLRVFAEEHNISPSGGLGEQELAMTEKMSIAAPMTNEQPAVEPTPILAIEVQAEGESPQTETGTISNPEPANTPVPPMARALEAINIRAGPGVVYPIVGALNVNAEAEIVGKNPEADWWQVLLPSNQQGWVFTSLVSTVGNTAAIAVAQNIPELPHTPTPAPIAEVPLEQPHVEEAPAVQIEEAPVEAAPPPSASGNDFVLVERRLWDVYENGGSLNGPSVTCGEKHELFVNVIDANGNRLNGVAVQSVYNGETFETGTQGKGDGVVEYILWGDGQGVKIARDVDGREVSSDSADGLTPRSLNILHEDLISARYCTDTASCDKFNVSAGCWGHHSWTVTFQRKH